MVRVYSVIKNINKVLTFDIDWEPALSVSLVLAFNTHNSTVIAPG